MRQPIRLEPLGEYDLAQLVECYHQGSDAQTRTRYQMVLLAHQGQTVPQIAPLVLKSEDTVRRVLHRYLQCGLQAVPRQQAPGGERTVTEEWEGELVRAIELDPREVGVECANWTTGLRAPYLGQYTGIEVNQETVRRYLHKHGYVCPRYALWAHLDTGQEGFRAV